MTTNDHDHPEPGTNQQAINAAVDSARRDQSTVNKDVRVAIDDVALSLAKLAKFVKLTRRKDRLVRRALAVGFVLLAVLGVGSGVLFKTEFDRDRSEQHAQLIKDRRDDRERCLARNREGDKAQAAVIDTLGQLANRIPDAAQRADFESFIMEQTRRFDAQKDVVACPTVPH